MCAARERNSLHMVVHSAAKFLVPILLSGRLMVCATSGRLLWVGRRRRKSNGFLIDSLVLRPHLTWSRRLGWGKSQTPRQSMDFGVYCPTLLTTKCHGQNSRGHHNPWWRGRRPEFSTPRGRCWPIISALLSFQVFISPLTLFRV